MKYKNFYSELGKLLYAVADIDKIITSEEKKKLQEIVRTELVPAENHMDNFGTDAAYYTEMEFDFLEEQIADTETAFNSFVDYVEDHHTAFDSSMKKVVVKVAKEIANAYHKSNKKEKELIKQLTKKLNHIEFKS